MPLSYLSGFGNQFASEALPGALPEGQNSPQRCPYGLYAEQISGTPFTAPRAENRRSWLYRIRPSVKHQGRYHHRELPYWKSAPDPAVQRRPLGQLRWGPVPFPRGEDLTFLTGIRTMTTAGDVATQAGMAAHIYLATAPMQQEYFANADGELLVVPQQGGLRFATEFGVLEVAPGEVCVLPRGVKFRAEPMEERARGYVCENYGAPLALPELGPIGANGLANPRDFLTPVAAFEDREELSRLTVKWSGTFHVCEFGQSPLDVVAWHGNYVPYKYDLKRFCR
jgi:homogentisate 1,2-dioxygenase